MSYRQDSIHTRLLAGERRDRDRVELEIFLNQYIGERLVRALATNLSPSGLFARRVFPLTGQLPLGREAGFVQLELALPGVGDTIWAQGAIRHDLLELGPGVQRSRRGGCDAWVHGTGIELVAIARPHRQLLRDYIDYVHDCQRQQLEIGPDPLPR